MCNVLLCIRMPGKVSKEKTGRDKNDRQETDVGQTGKGAFIYDVRFLGR